MYYRCYFTICFVWLWNVVSYFEGKTQTTSVCKQSAQEIFGPKGHEVSDLEYLPT
jgi:hypothetical protein